jgi:hypothetical protein
VTPTPQTAPQKRQTTSPPFSTTKQQIKRDKSNTQTTKVEQTKRATSRYKSTAILRAPTPPQYRWRIPEVYQSAGAHIHALSLLHGGLGALDLLFVFVMVMVAGARVMFMDASVQMGRLGPLVSQML